MTNAEGNIIPEETAEELQAQLNDALDHIDLLNERVTELHTQLASLVRRLFDLAASVPITEL
jgi:hypothetical protein